MIHHKKTEDAVSPVVGVMLMIVVTIVIAAVITAFATGTAGDSTATTPMAIFEADNQQLTGDYLYSFDLVHKGGDEMALNNLQVTLEPVDDEQFGIILVRTSDPAQLDPSISAQIEYYQQMMDEYDMEGELRVETLSGDMQLLSVRGKTGEDAVISTGDRIKVIVKPVGCEVKLDLVMDGEVVQEIDTLTSDPSSTSFENMKSEETLVKWTLSDTRTNGVIAKGEFVVA